MVKSRIFGGDGTKMRLMIEIIALVIFTVVAFVAGWRTTEATERDPVSIARCCHSAISFVDCSCTAKGREGNRTFRPGKFSDREAMV